MLHSCSQFVSQPLQKDVVCCCGVKMLVPEVSLGPRWDLSDILNWLTVPVNELVCVGFKMSLPLDKGACVAVLCDCTVETLLTLIPVNRPKSEVGWKSRKKVVLHFLEGNDVFVLLYTQIIKYVGSNSNSTLYQATASIFCCIIYSCH